MKHVRKTAPPPARRTRPYSVPATEVFVRYRLLAEAPFTVSFPSVTYQIRWSHDRYIHRLEAGQLCQGGGYEIIKYEADVAHAFTPSGGFDPISPASRVIYSSGVTIRRPSVLDTIFQRLVREGRAELLEGPHSRVQWRGPNGEWIRG